MRIVCCVYLNRFILRLDSSVRVVRRLFVCVDKNQYKFIQQSAIKNIRTRYDCKLIIASTKKMQNIRQCMKYLALCSKSAINKTCVLPNATRTTNFIPACSLHLSSTCNTNLRKYKSPTTFLEHNKTIFPPQKPDEAIRPAYICHMKANIKYSVKNMWYIASFVRGMSVDEAVKQLSFISKKGAAIAKEVILEAQGLAVEEHNVEFKSNLWVAESFTTKGVVIKGIRRHAKMRSGKIRYGYCHYCVRLEEGPPPKHYYLPYPKNGEELLEDWLKQMHIRKVPNSL